MDTNLYLLRACPCERRSYEANRKAYGWQFGTGSRAIMRTTLYF